MTAAYAKLLTIIYFSSCIPSFVIYEGKYEFEEVFILTGGLISIIYMVVSTRIKERFSNQKFYLMHIVSILNNVGFMFLYAYLQAYLFAAIITLILFIIWFISFKGDSKFQ